MPVTQGTTWTLQERCWTGRSRPPRSTENQSMLMLGTSWTRIMQWTVWMSLIISTKRLCTLKLLWALSKWILLQTKLIDLLLTMKSINNSSRTLTCEVQECEWMRLASEDWMHCILLGISRMLSVPYHISCLWKSDTDWPISAYKWQYFEVNMNKV